MVVLEPIMLFAVNNNVLRKELLNFKKDGIRFGLLVNIVQFIINKSVINLYGMETAILNNSFHTEKCMFILVNQRKLLKLKLVSIYLFGIFQKSIRYKPRITREILKLFLQMEDIK